MLPPDFSNASVQHIAHEGDEVHIYAAMAPGERTDGESVIEALERLEGEVDEAMAAIRLFIRQDSA